ncbi:F-box protein [Aspergillus undulatus]|uniref:F-box protein n=1 Tax=Aspergillus undulatus TaxID=1810928 RepID=UPI003CCE264E
MSPPSSPPGTTGATLSKLPVELYLEIFSYLDYPSSLALSQTCTNFRAKAKVEAPTTRAQKALYLSHLECYTRYENLFSCRNCLLFLPASEFGDYQLMKKRSKGGTDGHLRFCLNCGLTKIYSRGQKVVVNGYIYRVCRDCRTLFG